MYISSETEIMSNEDQHEEEAFEEELPEIQRCDIPKTFYSDADEKPFTHCTVCGCDLQTGEVPYMIEKAYKRHRKFNITDTIFEYAMCMPCYMQMANKLSQESKENMRKYVEEHLNPLERMQNFYHQQDFDPDSWLQHCMFTGADKNELDEYQVMGQFLGDQMLFTELPAMISYVAADEMMQLMSNKTLDELDDFTDTFLGLPPEWKELNPKRTPVLI